MKGALGSKATHHFHITMTKGVCGGSPAIKGTRISVGHIAGYYHMGLTPEEIRREVPHITLAQIFDALAYYFDHKSAIDRKVERDREEHVARDFPSGKY